MHMKILLFTIGRVAGSASLHQASTTQMSIAVECLVHLYDWCTTLLINMKKQLTSIRKEKTRHFGYGTILMTLFFEKIPGLWPKVISSINSPRDPRISQWADLMKRLGESEVPRTTWDDEFFQWWEEQAIAVEDYPYVGMDFRGDPNLVLPPGVAWGAIGEISIFYFWLYDFLWIFSKYDNEKIFFDWTQMTYNIIDDHDVDMGPVKHEGYPRHKRRRGEADAEDPSRTLHAVQKN